MDEKERQPQDSPRERVVDLESLKALAHPLRVRIIDVLSTYGAFTASGLAERLGESSGATSYHLRQLEKHGFVREVPDKGVGRERWWERSPGGITLASKEFQETQAGREASRVVVNEWASNRERILRDFIDRGFDELPENWIDASLVSLVNVVVTAEQLHEFTEQYKELVDRFADAHRGQKVSGARPVHLQFHGFPVLDGTVLDGPEPSPDTDQEGGADA